MDRKEQYSILELFATSAQKSHWNPEGKSPADLLTEKEAAILFENGAIQGNPTGR